MRGLFTGYCINICLDIEEMQNISNLGSQYCDYLMKEKLIKRECDIFTLILLWLLKQRHSFWAIC